MKQQTENIYLKANFISYLQGKNLAQSSIDQCINYVEWFFNRTGKQALSVTKADILNYLELLKNKKGQQNSTRQNNLSGLNHYFTFLLTQEQINANPCALLKIRGTQQRTLCRTYTPEELTTLYDNFYTLFVRSFDDSHIPKNQRKQSTLSKQRNAVILNVLIHQGATTKEIDTLQLCDLDLMNATLKIRAGRKSNERTLPLAATQIGVLMYYLQMIRPQLLEHRNVAESEKLFLPLPEYTNTPRRTGRNTETAQSLMHIFKPFVKQLKSIDPNFTGFDQIRASVITNWLTVHGLRKTQVMAGHRYISSTERYFANNLNGLTSDINNYHPF